MKLGYVSFLVHDYDEAIRYFTKTLGFQLIEDEGKGESRWVVVAPCSNGSLFLLKEARTSKARTSVGNQAGDDVAFILQVGSFHEEYARMKKAGVTFLEQAREEDYGTVVVFEDLYGNKWDLIQPTKLN